MTDNEHHEHDVGAHEVDKMPSGRLFNLLFGLSALTLVACIGVVQLFNRQVDSIEGARHKKVSFQLSEYRQEMDGLTDQWGVVLFKDDDGVAKGEGGKGPHEDRRYFMPLEEAKKRVLEEPAKLKAQRPYRGWKNPDPNAPKPTARPTRPGRPGALGRPAQPRPAQPAGIKPAQPRIVPGARPQPGAPAQPGAAPAQPGAAPAQPAAPAAPGGDAPAKPEPANGAGADPK
ncbi:MAG: hypothetical protein AB1Z98_29390 [Nannocystaceae bacterium]